MGGLGSGRTRDFNSKTTVDDVNRISTYDLKKQGMLQPGTVGTIFWSYGDRLTESVNFHTFHDRLVLDYCSRQNGGEWEQVEETIQLTWTRCNYGGKRPWFRCPGCSRRVAVLCDHGERFLCRRCYRLPYASQQRSYGDRMEEQARKVRRRLGATENLNQRSIAAASAEGQKQASATGTSISLIDVSRRCLLVFSPISEGT